MEQFGSNYNVRYVGCESVSDLPLAQSVWTQSSTPGGWRGQSVEVSGKRDSQN